MFGNDPSSAAIGDSVAWWIWQSLGLFVGGLAGGLAAKAFGLTGIFLFCLGILSIWGIMSLGLVEIGARSAGRSADHPTGG